MSSVFKIQPKHRFRELTFPKTLMDQIQELLDDNQYQEALIESGLRPTKKILLHGPSGCGKTSIAHALAAEMDLPIWQLSLADTVDSHIGQTGKNLAEAMKFATLNKAVVLLDEFDAISGRRQNAEQVAGSEHNKSVNTLLVELESNEPRGLLVACTNHMDLIDNAVLRRFDGCIEVPAPDVSVLEKIARDIFGGRFGLGPKDIWLTAEDTPATVTLKARALLRRKVIQKAKLEDAKTGEMFQTDNPAKEIREKLTGATA